MNCNVCGSANLIEGSISEGGSLGANTFVPGDKSFVERPLGGGRETHSYACVQCGNLQFTVDFSEDDKKQYLEFEGQQPVIPEPPDENDVLDEKLEVSE